MKSDSLEWGSLRVTVDISNDLKVVSSEEWYSGKQWICYSQSTWIENIAFIHEDINRNIL